MQTLFVTGNLGSDAVTRTTQRGDKVTAISVGSKQGYGDNATTNWFRCSIWGERGEKIAQYLLKGVKVTVAGELTIGSYEGKPQFDLRVNEIEWERRDASPRQDRGGDGSRGAPQQPADDMDEDFVPFMSAIEPARKRII